ncbi:RNA polymerase sigma factor [Hyphomicrobium sp.]|uniref:RNA polymerase sigma factor n=1 Tax=Hyphomicrobium sp. TaxID=82 RepID=UPI002E340223|nr:RNA polymerase sigma factor [Hyphomicrobium sp.]HEX2842376.1 RNA polymerase sigma factor [Hyphomicrobium sp.]
MTYPQRDAAARTAESDLVSRALSKDEAAIRAIIQANNRRLYRAARSIVKDDSEAEDIVQEAYLRAFSALDRFRGDSSLSTWLTRIVINEALQRLRRAHGAPLPADEGFPLHEAQVIQFPTGDPTVDPERATAQKQLCRLLERAIDDLPEEFRVVLVARVIETMSVEETAQLLGLRPETVKTRLHRARRLLRDALSEHVDSLFSDVFPFDGPRCERITDSVIKRLNAQL